MRYAWIYLVPLIILSSASVYPPTTELKGTWVRKPDELKIRILEDSTDKMFSFIVDPGEDVFPCQVSHFPIYKNIIPAGRNLWTCDFLVVTMGSCATDYEPGIIRVDSKGDMEITCPGFEKKFYSRLRPRKE